MVPFYLQLELQARLATIAVEQLDQIADEAGFMRYQIKTFNHTAVVFVNIEDAPQPPVALQATANFFEAIHYPTQNIGYSLDHVFSLDEVIAIAGAIREYNSSRKLNFDQMHFDF